MNQVFLSFLLIVPLLLVTTAAVAGQEGRASKPGPPETVNSVDLQRYAGLWYEIAKIPNRFQRKCDSGTTAQYTPREDGMISVVNRCIKADGIVMEAEGIARVVDLDSRAKLEVSFVRLFGLQLFWGDYWVIGLDPDYQYAVVGHPDRRYGWVLARTAALTPGQWAEVRAVLRARGYDPDDFDMTMHAGAGSPGSAETGRG